SCLVEQHRQQRYIEEDKALYFPYLLYKNPVSISPIPSSVSHLSERRVGRFPGRRVHPSNPFIRVPLLDIHLQSISNLFRVHLSNPFIRVPFLDIHLQSISNLICVHFANPFIRVPLLDIHLQSISNLIRVHLSSPFIRVPLLDPCPINFQPNPCPSLQSFHPCSTPCHPSPIIFQPNPCPSLKSLHPCSIP